MQEKSRFYCNLLNKCESSSSSIEESGQTILLSISTVKLRFVNIQGNKSKMIVKKNSSSDIIPHIISRFIQVLTEIWFHQANNYNRRLFIQVHRP